MSNMTAAQDRARLIRMVAAMVERGALADAYDVMADAERMGRTHRWWLASVGLRIALHDAACGDPIDLSALLAAAKRAAH